MPLLIGWFPSQSGGDEIRESRMDAFSNLIPWQLTWVQWFELQNVLAESELPEYRKPSDESYDETDSKIWIVWRTDDGEKTQTLSGSQAEALEAVVLGIAEEAYAASKLETEHLYPHGSVCRGNRDRDFLKTCAGRRMEMSGVRDAEWQ